MTLFVLFIFIYCFFVHVAPVFCFADIVKYYGTI
jgi:hypothetical protein